jgi:hypothetical protein
MLELGPVTDNDMVLAFLKAETFQTIGDNLHSTQSPSVRNNILADDKGTGLK